MPLPLDIVQCHVFFSVPVYQWCAGFISPLTTKTIALVDIALTNVVTFLPQYALSQLSAWLFRSYAWTAEEFVSFPAVGQETIQPSFQFESLILHKSLSDNLLLKETSFKLGFKLIFKLGLKAKLICIGFKLDFHLPLKLQFVIELLLLQQPFYGPLDFVWDYLGEPVPEK